MALLIRGAEPASVFRLLGTDENSASFALGWCLEHSSHYRKLVVDAVFGEALDSSEVVITLQKHSVDRGYTDVEIQAGRDFHVIFEAKRWWDVPTVGQLTRYVPRLIGGRADRQRLVSISSADESTARRHLPPEINGVPVAHRSWRDLRRMAREARRSASSIEEKLWLRELAHHLQEFVEMERHRDNLVFVVALNGKPMVQGQSHTWIDVVEKDGRYFHPVGNNWPPRPPNYIGFRYAGRLQSVHHIESFEIVRNLAAYNPLWLETDEDHFVYTLGPAMRPMREVRLGAIYPSGRVWCAIDTLLSGAFETVSAARAETERRFTAEE